MQDVADAAGVHRTTVSLAIRQHPSIPETTRKRILNLADSLGYRPNPMVSALMSQLRHKRSRKQHEIIAYVTTNPPDNPWRRYPSLREMFAGAQSRAAALGFAVQEFDARAEGMSGHRIRKILQTRGIRGLLLAPMPSQWGSEELDLDFSQFAAASLGLSLKFPPLERVASDHYQCMRLVFARCLSLGYQRIGLVIGQEMSARLEGRWIAAHLYEQNLLPPAQRVSPLPVQDRAHWWMDPAVEEWCLRERPDVIALPLGDTDWRALAILPGAPGVVNLTLPAHDRNCAGILQNTFRLGEIGVERVVSRLLHNDLGPLDSIQTTMLHGDWVDGASLPPRG